MSWGGLGQTVGGVQAQQAVPDVKLPNAQSDSISSLAFAPSDNLNLIAAGAWDGAVSHHRRRQEGSTRLYGAVRCHLREV